jgi:hypothetical protein
MTRDDVLWLALKSGLRPDLLKWLGKDGTLEDRLVCFAALVEAHEREACAKVCEAEATIEGIAQRCAEAIRARGEK